MRVGKDTGTPAQATQIYRIVERYHAAGWPPELLQKACLDGGAIASRLLSGGRRGSIEKIGGYSELP